MVITPTTIDQNKRREVEALLTEKAIDNRIPCAVAIAIARQTGTPPGEVGRIADELAIRIKSCQLGCF